MSTLTARNSSRRMSHDLTYLFIAFVMVALAGIYAAGVGEFFGGWDRLRAAPQAWLFIGLILTPSAFLLIALAPVAADWKRTRPRVWR